ncbi:hypothetical protein DSO57_1038850 [Entomophthora muscae]|uniref:Uncharacterized protein n=1 Tax=Entomophthora muscae TaxID=34485 RepID=A0ACC2S0R0_9FUNG|nr:hypothetical protein DSO57_1038850 [Entomophthora muscae]
MKSSVAVLICLEVNTSMPGLIAEAKYTEKCTNMKYSAHNSNHNSNSNSRDHYNGNKRQNTNHKIGNSNQNNDNHSQGTNLSCPKKEDTAKVTMLKQKPAMNLTPHSMTSKASKQRNRE